MIISGLQTGNTRWLAAHLQNALDNEHIELAQIRGTVAQDVDGALAEFDAFTAGTRAKEGVYAAFINPPAPLSREQFMRALDVMERWLGLVGQPRIVLFHVKAGRHHCHAVWSRIDVARMKAIQLSHDRQKLRGCARELAAKFGFELPPGLAQDRGAERFDDFRPRKAEKAMAELSGIAIEQRRDAITACYRESDSAQAFVNALEAAGYMLARGDRRSFVVVDIAGDVHSLARQIDGAKTRDVREKLEGLNLSLLPPVERAKVLMAQRAQAQQDAMCTSVKRQAEADDAAARLRAAQAKRRAAVDLLWQQMRIRQMHEWKVLLAHIKADEELRLRRHWTQIGLARYLRKIAVIRQLLEYYAEKKRRSLEDYHLQLKESLRRRHENEARELQRHYEALLRLERREQASLQVMCGSLSSFATSESKQAALHEYTTAYSADAICVETVEFTGYERFAGWETARTSLPAGLSYDLLGPDGGQSAELTVSLTFNLSAEGLTEAVQHMADTEDEKAGSSARRPGGFSMR